jgi:hypothetical protein
VRDRKIRHQQVVALVVRHLRAQGGAAHVSLIIRAPRAVGVRQPNGRRIFGTGLDVADLKMLRDIGKDSQLGVRDPKDALGVKGALNFTRARFFLVGELDVHDVAREVGEDQPFRLGATASISLPPVRI